MNRSTFLKRLGIGVVAAPVVVEALGEPAYTPIGGGPGLLALVQDGTVMNIHGSTYPRWKPSMVDNARAYDEAGR
jgi:hypothetical protein